MHSYPPANTENVLKATNQCLFLSIQSSLSIAIRYLLEDGANAVLHWLVILAKVQGHRSA